MGGGSDFNPTPNTQTIPLLHSGWADRCLYDHILATYVPQTSRYVGSLHPCQSTENMTPACIVWQVRFNKEVQIVVKKTARNVTNGDKVRIPVVHTILYVVEHELVYLRQIRS